MTKRTCVVDGCEGAHEAKGYCAAHYARMRKYGDPLHVPPPRKRDDSPCVVDGCETVRRARGMCITHYSRWRLHGDPSSHATAKARPFEYDDVAHAGRRFWSKVKLADGCWEWQGAKHPVGYGNFTLVDGVSLSAHRMSWLLVRGDLGADDHILHVCDNPPCVNPGHLRVGTHADNMADANAKGRLGRRKG